MNEISQYETVLNALAAGLRKTHLANAAKMPESSVRKASEPDADPRLSTIRRMYAGYCILKAEGKLPEKLKEK